MKRKFVHDITINAFMPKDRDCSEEEEQQVKDAFGISDAKSPDFLKTPVQLTLNVESLLFQLFTKIEPPKAPLKVKKHERWMNDLADKLNEMMAIEDDEAFPYDQLSKEDLKKIEFFMTDDEEFEKLEVMYEARVDERKEPVVLKLPCMNLLMDSQLVDTLDKIFSTPEEDGEVEAA